MDICTRCKAAPVRANSLCMRCYQQDWYRANSAKVIARSRAWEESNELHATQQRAVRNRRWQIANPERAVKAVQLRHKRLKTAGLNNLTRAEWRDILTRFDGCAYCGCTDKPLTQDHIIPVAKGGSHTADNVVPACAACNSKKGTRTAEEFLGSV